MSVLFVQKQTHRAGAQTCLARLLCHRDFQHWQPVTVCNVHGWLTSELKRAGICCLYEPFPSSRSLAGRLFLNKFFARRVAQQLRQKDTQPQIVHANDFTEGLLGLELAKILRAQSAIFLRSATMTRNDFFKYYCDQYDLIFAVGDELQARVKNWKRDLKVETIHDGLDEAEFLPPKPPPQNFPSRILVIGSSLASKGWPDLTEALFQLQKTNALPELEFDFTGQRPDAGKNDLKLERLAGVKCNFLGRVEQFRDLVRNYDLVINPSRMESFGMAAVEVVAAGVSLLSSRTGIIEQVIEQPEFLFSPGQIPELAATLKNLFLNWNQINFDSAKAQTRLREKFLIEHAVEKLTAEYQKLLQANQRR